MKKIVSLFLVLIMMAPLAMPAAAAMPEQVSPLYDFTSQAGISMTISDSGVASIGINCCGQSNCTSIRSRTYLTKQDGDDWASVDLGVTPNYWYYDVQGQELVEIYTFQLDEKGTYQAHVEFTVYGTGGTYAEETITLSTERTY